MDPRSLRNNNQTRDPVYGEVLHSEITKEESNEDETEAQFQDKHHNITLDTTKVMWRKCHFDFSIFFFSRMYHSLPLYILYHLVF